MRRDDVQNLAPGRRLRVAVVTESFLPTRNGVTTSVCRVLEHLRARGHDAVVVCPGPAPESYAGAPVVTVPAVRFRQFPVGLPTPALRRTLRSFAPDVVHLASPFVLGARGARAAARLELPAVAVFQTDVAGFAKTYHLGALSGLAWRWVRRIHATADLTLAPSTATLSALESHAVPRLRHWARGVDGDRFRPGRRVAPGVVAARKAMAPHGETIVGYIGRVAPEKRVERLAALADVPGVKLVVGGDGPARATVERALRRQDATFLGWLDGDRLADAYALLDVFVHTGTEETFGQTLQEAQASGLPVVAPGCGGPLDLVRPGVNGLLYEPEDDAGLAAAVATIAGDPLLRARMSLAARSGVEHRSWEALGDELIGHYRTAIGERPAVPLVEGA
ncbi:glycosyltransferase family 4 protein [Spongisporangium articulatum]|uniref:Glycosyltransferase family 4 protein n=1 Tax=Spongisporangium articulatum TaxID=3362603 RepID=A0ABW8AGY7_9ACTN